MNEEKQGWSCYADNIRIKCSAVHKVSFYTDAVFYLTQKVSISGYIILVLEGFLVL